MSKHTTTTLVRVRELHDQGYLPTMIQRQLKEEGVRVSLWAITRWTGEQPVTDAAKRWEEADRVIGELRELGLSYPAISVVLGHYHGIRMTGETVRRRAHANGLGKNPKKIELANRYLQGRAA